MFPFASQFNERLRETGFSHETLARATGLSVPAIQRILSGKHTHASFANIQKIAAALGFEIELKSTLSGQDVRERRARQKAEQLVRQVQATSALEGQAVDRIHLEDMIRQTTHELLAGPSRHLWSE